VADAANTDWEFVALRGFEWSHFRDGHMNVWAPSGSPHLPKPDRPAPSMLEPLGAGTEADLSHRSSWRDCMRDD
jgi:hypothetical protein